MNDEEDDIPTCPLCLEELDATDRAVEACQCGYQVCLWCLHHIREQLNSLCPACRTPYQEQNFKYAEVNPEQAAKEARERATAKKERERREKLREIEKERARAIAVSQQKAKNNLKHARILQRNLVYVIGLSLTLAREEVIRRADMFGKFGRIIRILVNRAHPFNTDAPGGPSISAYVQYIRDCDASAAVRAMNNAVLDGREIRCAIATTKYCDAFVRTVVASDPHAVLFCGINNCMYYHAISQEVTLTREEVLAHQLGPPPPAHLFLPADTRRPHPPMRLSNSSPLRRPLPSRPMINAPPSMGAVSSAPAIHPPSIPLPPNSSAPIINPPLNVLNPKFSSPHASPRHPLPHPHQSPHPIHPTHSTHMAHSSYAAGPPHPSHQSHRAHPPIRTAVEPPSPSRRSPPASPPGRVRPATHSQRSPSPVHGRGSSHRLHLLPTVPSHTKATVATSSAMDPATVSAPTSAPAPAPASDLTASSPPFASAPRLPATAGWAGAKPARAASQSPPRRELASSTDDPARSYIRAQMQRSRENAPPGFDEPSSLPKPAPLTSHPPGFDPSVVRNGPVSSRSSIRNAKQENGKLVPMHIAVPPGFGLKPSEKRTPSSPVTTKDVAAAWSQEASSDQVFCAHPRGVRSGAIGRSLARAPSVAQDDPAARNELAQVLAKLGGDLGVSSEFQKVQTTAVLPVLSGQQGPPGMSEPVHRPFDSLSGSQLAQNGYPTPTQPQSPLTASGMGSNTASSSGAAATPSGTSFGMYYSNGNPLSPFLDASPNSRRSNSRFGFAREDPPEQPAVPPPKPVAAHPRPRVRPPGEWPNTKGTHAATGPFRVVEVSSPDTSSSITKGLNGLSQRTISNSGKERHPRSRFDFADYGSSPPRGSAFSARGSHYVAPPQASVTSSTIPNAISGMPEPQRNEASALSFSQLSTEEKLASLFNSAQWSGEQLPPMPNVESRVDPVLVTSAVAGTTQLKGPPVMRKGTPVKRVSSSLAPTATQSRDLLSDANARVAAASSATQPVQFAPPGFKEATPGITPEPAAVDRVSTSSGVAENVASGGVASRTKGNGETCNVNQVDETISSGTESLEDERKKSRSQRKRDKKTRQQKGASQRKLSNGEQSSSPSAQPRLQKTQPSSQETRVSAQQAQVGARQERVSVQEAQVVTQRVQTLLVATDQSGPVTQAVQMGQRTLVSQGGEAHVSDTVISMSSSKDSGEMQLVQTENVNAVKVSSGVKNTVATEMPAAQSDASFDNTEALREAKPNFPVSERPDARMLSMSSKFGSDRSKVMSVTELEKEVEAARVREAHLQDKLMELQQKIRSYDHLRT